MPRKKRRLFSNVDRRLSVEALEDRRLLATFSVSNLSDAGTGSLRAAIDQANANSGADDIAFVGAATIGTISLTSGELEITEDLTINGPGQGLTIDAQQNSRVINFTGSGDLALERLSISGGITTGNNSNGFDSTHSGGGIRFAGGVYGLLTLDNVTVSGNRTEGDRAKGGGVFSSGSVLLTDSTVSGNVTTDQFGRGAGVYALRTANILSSTISGNRTEGRYAAGGGVFAEDLVTLTNSTVSDNSTTGRLAHGGGVFSFFEVNALSSTISGNSTAGNSSHGGGIRASLDVTLTNSTVSGNTTTGVDAAGGGVSAKGAILLTQSTVTKNESSFSGSGIHNFYGSIAINGSIVSGNGFGGFDVRLGGTTTITASVSILGTGVPVPAGTSNTFTDSPMLGPLGANGGPTETHAILPGSPAIDGGNLSPELHDQRGAPFVRTFGTKVDIGAFEMQTFPSSFLIVDSSSNIDDGDYSAGQFTLREAIVLANVNPGADTIFFDPVVSGDTMNLAGTELVVTEALTIDATSIDSFEIDADGGSRIFNILASAGDFTFTGLQLVNGRTTENFQGGSAISSSSSDTLTIDRSHVSGNRTEGVLSAGGAIYAIGDVVLNDSTVINNSTTGLASAGGGIFTTGNVTITNSDVNQNSTASDNSNGGGIRSNGNVTATDSNFFLNSTAGQFSNGAAIRANGNVTLLESIVLFNSTTGDGAKGGGISSGGNTTATLSAVTANSTLGSDAGGGGIHTSGDVFLLANTEVDSNTTAGEQSPGGGVLSSGEVMLDNSSSAYNSTSGDLAEGGGISASGQVTLTASTVRQNDTTGQDSNGGGIHSGGTVTLTDSTVDGNSTSGDDANGGGILAEDGVLLSQSTVSGNSIESGTSGSGGGGVRSYGPITIMRSTITENHANNGFATGGGIWNFDDPLTITNSIVDANTVGFGGNRNIHRGTGTLNIDFSLIQQFALPINGSNNITTMSANLGPLANNGGATRTHALLPGSPAIDAGDPAILFDANGFDQRGEPFVRVFDDSFSTGFGIDMGSYERQMLPLVVDNLVDEQDGDYSTGDMSLREAIGLANDSLGNDIITFDASLSNQTIVLDGTRILIFEEVTIDASGLAENVTIDAGQQSRVLDFTASTGDLSLTGLTITGGRTVGDNSNATELTNLGGGIRFLSDGELVLTNSTVTGNRTEGFLARGGGIFSLGAVSLIDSTVEGNSTAGNYAHGGGIYSSSGAMTLTNSTVTGNSTAGFGADGGGIHFRGSTLTLMNSTASGNSTTGGRSDGGGIYSQRPVTFTNSTLSGNSTGGYLSDGGGLYSKGAVAVDYSTIADNHANGGNALGGGIWNQDDPLDIRNSIVAGNSASGGMNDIEPGTGSLTVAFSLVEQTGLSIGTGNNVIGMSASLAPLADNGGPTQTHELLPASPAIDAGDPAIAFSPTEFDQRGEPFPRVIDGDGDTIARIDMGALESQSAITLACDFDSDDVCDIEDIDALMMEIAVGTDNLLFDLTGDGMVDLADRDEWLFDAGTLNLASGNPYLAADSNLDGTVDGQDFLTWNGNKFTTTGTWSLADWNGDGATDGQDFLIWNTNKFQSGSSTLVAGSRELNSTRVNTKDAVLVDDRDAWRTEHTFMQEPPSTGEPATSAAGCELSSILTPSVFSRALRPAADSVIDPLDQALVDLAGQSLSHPAADAAGSPGEGI